MAASQCQEEKEFRSGDIVEPGLYLDIETGSVVQIQERDELPDGSRMVHYRRRFRRVAPEALELAKHHYSRG
jgi:hypothetical protein